MRAPAAGAPARTPRPQEPPHSRGADVHGRGRPSRPSGLCTTADEAGGNANADDPAIWRNPADPGRSLVIATAKQGGLRAYDLDARQVQSIPAPAGPGPDDKPGRFNNVDLVQGLRLGGARADVAVVSDRGNDRLRIYRIDRDKPGGPLTDVTDPGARPVFSADQAETNEQKTAYGLATWTDRATGRSYALVSRRNRTR
ncbi:phytase, partial [Streptomyces litmocidini]